MRELDVITRSIAAASSLAGSSHRSIEGLAERTVVTSDDQNVQRLARDLRAALPTLVEAIPAKADHP